MHFSSNNYTQQILKHLPLDIYNLIHSAAYYDRVCSHSTRYTSAVTISLYYLNFEYNFQQLEAMAILLV